MIHEALGGYNGAFVKRGVAACRVHQREVGRCSGMGLWAILCLHTRTAPSIRLKSTFPIPTIICRLLLPLLSRRLNIRFVHFCIAIARLTPCSPSFNVAVFARCEDRLCLVGWVVRQVILFSLAPMEARANDEILAWWSKNIDRTISSPCAPTRLTEFVKS